jgi:acyl carrier protein
MLPPVKISGEIVAKLVSIELLKDLIVETNPEVSHEQIQPDTDLFDAGILDSFSVLNLVQALEDKLDIVFDYKDLQRHYLSNLKSLLGLLTKNYDCTESK